MAEDVVIRISGDAKKFKEALNDVQSKTEDLSGALEQTTKIAGVAFAALTAEIGLSVHAYAEAEAANKKLTLAMQNQGVYSKDLIDSYRDQAKEVQKLTGLDDDAVIAAQAKLQTFIGQRKITPELTQAMADLSTQTGSLESASEVLGRAVEGNVRGLKAYGITIQEGMTRQERFAAIMEQVNQKFGGQAEAANKGLGSIQGLKTAFGNLQEEIGARFAPVVEVVIKKMTQLFTFLSENKALVDFGVSMLAAGAAVTGLVTVVGTVGYLLLQFKAAMVAAGVATKATTLLVKGLVGATGLGLLVLLVSEIALNWNSVWPRMQAVFKAFVDNIATLGQGLGAILSGVFTFDMAKIKEGLDKVKNAVLKGFDDYKTITAKKLEEIRKIEEDGQAKQDAAKASSARRAQAMKDEQDRRDLAAQKAHSELKLLEAEDASSAMIALKKKEIEDLNTIADEKFRGDRDGLAAHAEDMRALQQEQHEIDLEQKNQFEEEILQDNEEFAALSAEQQALFMEQHGKQMQEQVLTEKSVNMEIAKQKADQQIKSNNQFLIEQRKFGTAYATINRAMHSEIYTGTKQAFGEMAALQQSSNSTLKGIGKIAATANIVIKTAESAMNVFAGFSTIPIIGPSLGLAAAAAVVAYGAEQVGKVQAAAEGGLITGGRMGVDSVPVLAQHGELIAPVSNYEEVIGSVRAAREAERVRSETGAGPGGGSMVMIGFDGSEASRVLTARQIEDERLGISPRGSA